MLLIKFIKKIFNRLNRKSYYHKHHLPEKMIKVRCVDCNEVFLFDGEAIGANGPSRPDEQFAQRYVIYCSRCGAKNMIWLKRPNIIPTSDSSYHMDVIVVKNEPQKFR